MKLSEIEKEWLRVDELQEILNIPRSSAYKLVTDGHFVSLRLKHPDAARGSIRISTKSVRDFIRRQVALFQLEEGIFEETVQGVQGVSGVHDEGEAAC